MQACYLSHAAAGKCSCLVCRFLYFCNSLPAMVVDDFLLILSCFTTLFRLIGFGFFSLFSLLVCVSFLCITHVLTFFFLSFHPLRFLSSLWYLFLILPVPHTSSTPLSPSLVLHSFRSWSNSWTANAYKLHSTDTRWTSIFYESLFFIDSVPSSRTKARGLERKVQFKAHARISK